MQAIIWAHRDVHRAMAIGALGTAALSAIALKVVSATAPVKALLVVAAAVLNYAAFYTSRGWAFLSFDDLLDIRFLEQESIDANWNLGLKSMLSQYFIPSGACKRLIKEALLSSNQGALVVADFILKECPWAAEGFEDDQEVLESLIHKTECCNVWTNNDYQFLVPTVICRMLDGSPNLAMKKFTEYGRTTTILHKAICTSSFYTKTGKSSSVIIIKKVLKVCPRALEITNSDGRTPFWAALHLGFFEALKLMVQELPKLKSIKHSSGRNPYEFVYYGLQQGTLNFSQAQEILALLKPDN